jgi:anaerobic ribonucleoside-triphosphate reductase activating protein
MGGEPLCDRNIFLTALLIQEVKKNYPDQKIYLWSGYVYEDLLNRKDNKTNYILDNIDCLIDGPFIKELKDVTLPMRGSSN